MNTIIAAILALACLGSAPPDRPAGPVVHIKITGDLDCDRLAADFAASLDAAERDGAALIVVEMDGDRWRTDVVWAMGKRVRSSTARVAAFLHDPAGRRVGTGQLMLGMLAGSCWISERTRVVGAAADDRRDLAPETTDWERVERELTGALWLAIQERAGDPQLGTLLARPTDAAWGVREESGGTRITTSAPATAADAIPFIVADPAGGMRVDMPGELCVRLKAAGEASSVARVVHGAGGGTGASRSRTQLVSALADKPREWTAIMEQTRVTLRRIERDLTLRSTDLGRRPTDADYRRAGDRARRDLDTADSLVAGADRLLGAYPELLRGPQGPGRAANLADCREELAELRARATEYSLRR